MFDLKNRIALVTGAGSGIGAAIATAFSQAGARVIVTDVQEEAAREVAGKIQESGGSANFLRLDVTSEADCQAAVDFVLSQHQHLDILVNNAGIGLVGTALNTSGADFDRLYSVNVRGVFNLSKAFLPSLVQRGKGVIINMASIGGVVAVRERTAYCTTKFAVVGLTKAMALDHAHQGIRVNCVCPGRVETPFVTRLLASQPDPEATYRAMCATQLTGRMLKPEEVAAAAVYLASDEAASITGTDFIMDGGWTVGK